MYTYLEISLTLGILTYPKGTEKDGNSNCISASFPLVKLRDRDLGDILYCLDHL